MKHFFDKMKHALVFKRVVCLLLAAVTLPIYAPQEADAAWKKGTSDGVYKIWEWYRLDTIKDSKGNLKIPVGNGYNRLLVVWKSGDKTYWTKNATYGNNNLSDYTSPWGHKDTWCTIVGEECSSVYYDADLSSFLTEDDLGTLVVDVNCYSTGANNVEKGRECLQILINNKDESKSCRGYEILSETECDSFLEDNDKNKKSWDEVRYAGYSLSEVGFKCNYGNDTIKTTLGNGKTYIMHPGYDNKDNDQWFAAGNVIACDGHTPYSDYAKGTEFVVYYGKEVNYSVLHNTVVLSNNCYKVDSHIFLTGDIVVEPGAVLSIEGKCFLNGNIKNYGTVIIQSAGMLCPFRPADNGATSGTLYNYGSLATYASVTANKEANGMAGEGIMIIMPGGVFAQTKAFGDLYFEKSAMLENHGTMLIARSMVAKQAQIANMSTGKVYFGYEPVEQYIPALDTMGDKILNHKNAAAGTFYYITEDKDSYFDNAGTWNTGTASNGKGLIEETSKTVNQKRKAYVEKQMEAWEESIEDNEAYFPDKGDDYYTVNFTADELAAAVERNQARSTVYAKLFSLGLVSSDTATLYNKEYQKLKTAYDKYTSERKAKLEAYQQEAIKKYPNYDGLSKLGIQQYDVDFLRECYLEENMLTEQEYMDTIEKTVTDKKDALYKAYTDAQEAYDKVKDKSGLLYMSAKSKAEDAMNAAKIAYDNYNSGTYQPVKDAVAKKAAGDDTVLKSLYGQLVLQVEAEARELYPDAADASTATETGESDEAIAAQTAIDVANCKAYLVSNYKTITEYRLMQQVNAEKTLSAMNARLALTNNDAYKANYPKKGSADGSKIYDKASYTVFGYPPSWDSTANWKIDRISHAKAEEEVVYDGTRDGVTWKGMTQAIVKSYVQNEIDEYKKNVYDPLMAALKDETKLHDMYTAYCKDIVEYAQKIAPKAKAQEIYDSIDTVQDLDELAAENASGKSGSTDAVTLARTTYYNEAKTKYSTEISKLSAAVQTAQENYEKAAEKFDSSNYEAKKKELNDKLAAYKQELDSLNAELADIQAQFNKLSWFLASERSKKSDLGKQLVAKEAEIEKLKTDTIKPVQDQLDELEKKAKDVNDKKAVLDAAQKACDDYLATFELDARALYPSKVLTEQEAKTLIERYRAEFNAFCKEGVDYHVLATQQQLTASGSTKKIDTNKTYSEAKKYYEAKAKDYYPDYKAGYTFPTFEVFYYADECMSTYIKTKTMIYYKD